ncbi:MAG: bifunctional folylpolyglutamate synthase/dihydrofolate synthase [Eubacteriales bacterium]|jgi:dihydrofolate synthase/folylpolyglutamate synthase
MTYQQALTYIESACKFGSVPTLERIRLLLQELDNPQERCRVIHIAGTNGKGSCAAMTAGGLRRCGYRVGLFTSPFVDHFTQRICVDGQEIPEERLAALVEEIRPSVEKLRRQGWEITQFDLLTAMAFLYFAQEGCDWCVMETGLGGELDPTNVVEHPAATVILSISYDHMAVLGNTLAQIASAKAGICKPGVPLVCYPDWPQEAEQVICRRAEQVGAPLVRVPMERFSHIRVSEEGTRFCMEGKELSLRLIGAHQVKNFACVYGLMQCLSVDEERFLQGVSETLFPGRLELLARQPAILMDGGHNREGVGALCSALDSILQGRRLITVMGMVRDKEIAPCVEQVASRSRLLVAVRPDIYRAEDPEVLADLAARWCCRCYAASSVEEGVRLALAEAGPEDVVLGCGSLYLLGEFRRAVEAIRQK